MSSIAFEKFANFCHLLDQLSSVNTKYNLPFQVDGMWLRWRYLSKKGLLPADSYGRVSPKQSPRWPDRLLCMPTRPSPCFELSLCARRGPNLGLFEVALAGGSSRKRKGECQDFIWHSGRWTTCHLLTGSVDIATKNRSDRGGAPLNIRLYRLILFFKFIDFVILGVVAILCKKIL